MSDSQSDNPYVELEKAKNNAYWERNQLVAALSKLYPSNLSKHPEDDREWEDDWRTIVTIYIPCADYEQKIDSNDPHAIFHTGIDGDKVFYQLTWHIHDSDRPLFDHLSYAPIKKSNFGYLNNEWDGHTTEEKYRRLRTLTPVTDLVATEAEDTVSGLVAADHKPATTLQTSPVNPKTKE